MAKEILFTNGAVQNRDYDLDDRPEKATGIIAARALNHLVGTPDIVHAWNNVGAFATAQEKPPAERLALKYSSRYMQDHLERWDASPDTIDIATDNDTEFSAWTTNLLPDILASGSVYLESADFTRCMDCDTAIAESAVAVTQCKNCLDDSGLQTITERALFTDIPENAKSLMGYHHLFNRVNIEHERNTFNQLPPRLLLSRDRSLGVPLDAIDLPGKVLDPRLGIGLLSVYLATVRGFNQAGIVQDHGTMIRTVPYLNAVIPDSNRLGIAEQRFAFHSKIHPSLLTSGEVAPEQLCLRALSRKTDVTEGVATELVRDKKALSQKRVALEDLAAKNGIELTNGAIDMGVMDGRINDINTVVKKITGAAIQAVKHRDNLDEETTRLLQDAYSTVRLVEQLY